jgi:uncharacterized membrane protein YfcA
LNWLELLLIPLGFVAAAYGTLVGAGGGFIMVPALLLIFPDESQQSITAVSLAVVLASSISGSIAYGRRRLIDYPTGLTFASAAVPASFLGAYVVRYLPRSWFDVAFGALLIGLAAFMALSARRQPTVREPLPPGPGIRVRTMRPESGVVYRYAYPVRLGVAINGVIGFISSLFGVGGGVMQVPMMVTVLRFPAEIAVATSAFMLVFMAAAGTSLHVIDGAFAGEELARAALLAAGAVPGAQAGALLARRLTTPRLARLLVVALVFIGGRLLLAPLFD